MYVCLCVSPVALCSHGQVDRLTVCESDTLSSNPAQCFFLLTTSYTCSLLACMYVCVARLVTWGVGPDVNYSRIIGSYFGPKNELVVGRFWGSHDLHPFQQPGHPWPAARHGRSADNIIRVINNPKLIMFCFNYTYYPQKNKNLLTSQLLLY